jgi:hypothetical protein
MAWGAAQNVAKVFFGGQLTSSCQEILFCNWRSYAKLRYLSDYRFRSRDFRRHLETARTLQVLRHGREV